MTPWDYFADVWVMTVDPEGERVKQLRQNLRRVGLKHWRLRVFERAGKSNLCVDPDQLTLWDILRLDGKSLGPAGRSLAQSHLRLVQDSLDSGAETVLVMEDDAIWDEELTTRWLETVVQWLRGNRWEVFNFGSMEFPIPLRIPVSPGVAVGIRPLLTHAIAMSRPGMQRAVELLRTPPTVQLDKLYAVTFPVMHVANPSLCFQSEPPALHSLAMQRLGPLFRGTARLTFKEFCQRYTACHVGLTGLLLLLAVSKSFGTFCAAS